MSLRRYSDGSVEINYYDEPTPDGERNPEDEAYRRARYPVWVEALKVFLMLSIFMFPVLFVVYYLGEGSFAYWYFPAGMLLMPIYSTILRRWSKSFFLFLLGHLALGLWVLLSPHIILTVICVVYLCILTLYGFVRVFSREKERDMSYLMLFLAMGIILFVYGLMVVQEMEGYEQYLLPQGLIWVVLFLFYKHRTNLMSVLKNMDKTGNFSTKHTIRFNTLMFLVYMTLAGVLFLVLYSLGLGKLLALVGRQFLLTVRRVVRFLASIHPTDQTLAQEEMEQAEITSEMLRMFEDPKASPFWVAAEKVLIFLFVLFMIALVFYVIVLLVRKYQTSARYLGAGYEEVKSFAFRSDEEKQRQRAFGLFDFSPENAIRRAYYRKVKGKMGKTVRPSDTPREVGAVLPEVAPMVESYEAARYQQTGGKGK